MPPSECVASGLLNGGLGSAPVAGEVHRRPNSASKMFWAEAVATEVTSVVTVMPVTKMSLTPRLKRVCRRINKVQHSPELRTNHSPRRNLSITFGGWRKYDLRVAGSKTFRASPCEKRTGSFSRSFPTSARARTRLCQSVVAHGHRPAQPFSPRSSHCGWPTSQCFRGPQSMMSLDLLRFAS